MPAHMTLNVVMPYTNEEEAWLKRQLQLVDDAYMSVPVGETITKEFMMFSLGVPLSKSYMVNFFSIIRERIWRIFKVHPDFEDLPLETQLKTFTEHCFAGISLMIIKAELCESGMEQLQLGFGKGEETVWKASYDSVFDAPQKIRKMSMANNNTFSPEQAASFSMLLEEAKDFVNDPILYKINLLMALFQDDGQTAGLNKVISKYSVVVRRRLEWMRRSKRTRGSNPVLTKSPDLVLGRMNYVVRVLNKMSAMVLAAGP